MLQRFFYRFMRRLFSEGITSYAAQISYYMILSLIPFVTLVGMILINTHLVTASGIINTLSQIHSIPEALREMVSAVFTNLERDSGQYYSIYIIVILYSSSRAMGSISNGLHRVYRTIETRPILVRFFLSIFYTVSFALMIVLFVALVLFGEALSKAAFSFLGLSRFYVKLITYLRYCLPLILMFITYFILYRFIPTKRVKFRFVFPGALLATIVSWVVSLIFSSSVSDISRYQSIYGGLSQIIIIIIWLWIICLILLIGAIFNSTLIEFSQNNRGH